MHADLESVRFQLSHQYHFTLLGSTRVKAAQKMLIKLTPDLTTITVYIATSCLQRLLCLVFKVFTIKVPLNNNYLLTTATISGVLRVVVIHKFDFTSRLVDLNQDLISLAICIEAKAASIANRIILPFKFNNFCYWTLYFNLIYNNNGKQLGFLLLSNFVVEVPRLEKGWEPLVYTLFTVLCKKNVIRHWLKTRLIITTNRAGSNYNFEIGNWGISQVLQDSFEFSKKGSP